MANFTSHSGISDNLVDKYDGFILDQFGVLHNGTTCLKGADEAVRFLQEHEHKKLVILSNSSALSDATLAKLPQLGFDSAHFLTAVTSGQEAANYVREHHQGQTCLLLTWEEDPSKPKRTSFLEACGNIQITGVVAKADFILLHGCQVIVSNGSTSEQNIGFHENGNLEIVQDILQSAVARNLPLVCANPDYHVVRPDNNTRAHMPGQIADLYQSMGGTVQSFGKPHREHFEACVRVLGLPKEKIVHVGDSIHHDIQGANDTGIASIFVTGGVHREELESELGELPKSNALELFFGKHKETPTHVVPLFQL